MLTHLLWLYMVVYAYALPIGDSKRDTPPAKAENKNNLKDAKLPLPFSSTTKLFGEEKNNENLMQNNADMNLGDNNDDEDEKYYNDDDEPDESCGKDSVQQRPEVNAPVVVNTPEVKEERYLNKCECVPRVNHTMINDNNDTVPCNDTCTSRSDSPGDGPDTVEDAEGDTEEDADDDPEDEDVPEEEEGDVREGGTGGFACHTCNTPVVEHHHHHGSPEEGGSNLVTENKTPLHETTKFHRHEHDHFHHESPQMITCLHDHHHHHHHHHQHHHFHYQPYCCKCDGKVMARHKSMDMSKVNSESPSELGSEVTDDTNVVSGDGEMMLVGPERPEWAPPPPDAENTKSRSVDDDSDLPSEHVQAEGAQASNNTESSSNATTKAAVSDAAKANVTQMVFSSVARICDFLHNKTNSYKVVHDDNAKRCCICQAPKSAQCRCECSPCCPCGHHQCGCNCCGDHCGCACGNDGHHYDSHDYDHGPCCCHCNEENLHHTHHHEHHHDDNHCGCPCGNNDHYDESCCQSCCGCQNRNLIKKNMKKKN